MAKINMDKINTVKTCKFQILPKIIKINMANKIKKANTVNRTKMGKIIKINMANKTNMDKINNIPKRTI